MVSVSRETHEKLADFVALLRKWNTRVQLISRNDSGEIWTRHVQDSLQLESHIPHGVTSAIDLGSGGGFPGLILAISTDIAFTLIEVDQRKAAFLQEAGRITNTPIRVIVKRIEAVDCPPVRLVTSRALARVSQLLSYSFPLLTPDGCCLFLKGKAIATELNEAAVSWNARIETFHSITHPEGVVLRLSEVRCV